MPEAKPPAFNIAEITYASPAFKQAMDAGNKYSKQRVYAAEGVSP